MASMRPFISIVIPTHNRGPFIRSSIRSALEQRYDNFEVVVVDDGSDDNTESIVNVISDRRLRYIRKPHSGAPDTRNFGVKSALGDYVLWLDSDDLLFQNVLDRYAVTIEKRDNVDVVYGDLEIFDDLGNRRALRYPDHCLNPNLFPFLIKGNIIPNGGSLVSKSLFEKVGLFDTNYTRAHDYEFWARSASEARFKHVGAMTYRWLWHGSNMSAENQKIDRSFEANIVDGLATRVPYNQLFPDLDWTNLGVANAEAHARVAAHLIHWKSDVKAGKYVERALSYNANNETALGVQRRLRSRKASRDGEASYSQQNYMDALESFKRATSIDPGNAQACNTQAVVYTVMGDRANAMKLCAAALKIESNDLDLCHNIAKILINFDQKQRAASLCAAVLERDPFASPMRALLRSMNSMPNSPDDEPVFHTGNLWVSPDPVPSRSAAGA